MELRRSVVYGPVQSRRLGSSLGINLLPFDRKVCSFDCVYCEYGVTHGTGKVRPGEEIPGNLLPTDDVLARIERGLSYFAAKAVPIDYVTFAGNGEPTLHPGFPVIVDHLIKARDRYFPDRPTAIFSDSDTLALPGVLNAILRLDRRFMKLDAGDERTFLRVSRPTGRDRWQAIIDGLCVLPSFTLQTAVVAGKYDNTSSLTSEAFFGLVRQTNPQEVHLYGIDRLPASPHVFPTDEGRLLVMAQVIREATGVPVRVLRDPTQWYERVLRDGHASAFIDDENEVARAEVRTAFARGVL